MGDVIRLHRQAYSKLIKGEDPAGPIVPRTEHDVTSRSRDFPDGIRRFTQPAHFFDEWTGVSLAVASDWAPQGAFLYQVIHSKSAEPFCLFARLQPRSEGGEDGTGRKFTHAVSLACPLSDWRPGLVLAVYARLFADKGATSPLGEPDVDAVAEQERMAQDPVEIATKELAEIENAPPAQSFWRLKQDDDLRFVINGDFPDTPSQKDIVASTLKFMKDHSTQLPFAILPFGIGLAFGTKGHGPGFALSIYAEKGEVSTVKTKFHTQDGKAMSEIPSLDGYVSKGKLDWRAALEGRQKEEDVPQDDPPLPEPPSQPEAEEAAKNADPKHLKTNRQPSQKDQPIPSHQIRNAQKELIDLAHDLSDKKVRKLPKSPAEYNELFNLTVDGFLDGEQTNSKSPRLEELAKRFGAALKHWERYEKTVQRQGLIILFELLYDLRAPFLTRVRNPDYFFHLLKLLAYDKQKPDLPVQFLDFLHVTTEALQTEISILQIEIEGNEQAKSQDPRAFQDIKEPLKELHDLVDWIKARSEVIKLREKNEKRSQEARKHAADWLNEKFYTGVFGQ